MHKIKKIIGEAYNLYMPQIRSEIFSLADIVMRDIASKKDPYNILEIGTKYGGTFYIWSSINPGPGMNISIDMNDGGLHGGISEEEMDKRDLWFQERFDNVHFIRGDSHSLAIRHQLYPLIASKEIMIDEFGISTVQLQSLDFLFIDGDHTKEGVKKDFEMYSPFVKKGGIVGFHDIVISDHHHSRDVYVGEFWNELTSIRLHDFQNPHKNVCIINGEEHRFTEFVEEGNNWGGVGVLFM